MSKIDPLRTIATGGYAEGNFKTPTNKNPGVSRGSVFTLQRVRSLYGVTRTAHG